MDARPPDGVVDVEYVEALEASNARLRARIVAAEQERDRLRAALRLTEAEQERVDFWKRPAGWGETRDAGVDDLLAIIDRLAALSEKEP